MGLKRIFFLVVLVLVGLNCKITAQETNNEEKYNPVPEIMEHIKDSHSWHYWGEGESSVVMHLPVIIIDNGLKVFSSSKFGLHGDHVANVEGNFYKIFDGKIYKTNENGTLTMGDNDKPINVKPLDFSITKNVLQIFFAAAILIFLAFATKRSYKKSQIPSGVARFIEPLVIFVRDEIALQNIGSVKYKKYVPYLVTLFLFLWIINVLGLIPTAANPSGNIAFTMILAVFTFIITQFSANRNYWAHIFDPLGNDMSFIGKSLVYIILVPVEILGMFTKPFALMIRHFANLTAGHIIVLSLVSLIFVIKSFAISPVSIGLTLFISVLEILVTALQAYIFTLLTALYIGMAVEEPHH